MVKLRLRRKGRIHHPIYDVVAVDGRIRRDGAFLERLGYFDPHAVPSTISINSERAIYWLNVGAQPSDIVQRLLSYDGVLLRRHLEFKGKTPQEIEEAVAQHKTNTASTYQRRKDLRKKREAKKAKEKAEKEAEAPAE